MVTFFNKEQKCHDIAICAIWSTLCDNFIHIEINRTVFDESILIFTYNLLNG